MFYRKNGKQITLPSLKSLMLLTEVTKTKYKYETEVTLAVPSLVKIYRPTGDSNL